MSEKFNKKSLQLPKVSEYQPKRMDKYPDHMSFEQIPNDHNYYNMFPDRISNSLKMKNFHNQNSPNDIQLQEHFANVQENNLKPEIKFDTNHPTFQLPHETDQRDSKQHFRLLSGKSLDLSSYKEGQSKSNVNPTVYPDYKQEEPFLYGQSMNDFTTNEAKRHISVKYLSYDYSESESEIEFETEELISIFVSIQQLFMICFLTLSLILFCMKSTVTNCMTFTFSISNLINSIIYLLIFTLFMVVSGFEIFSNNYGKDDYAEYFTVMILFGLIYGFNLFWSVLLLKVSKNLVPHKVPEGQTVLVQENLA
jgi:cation transport ATPase